MMVMICVCLFFWTDFAPTQARTRLHTRAPPGERANALRGGWRRRENAETDAQLLAINLYLNNRNGNSEPHGNNDDMIVNERLLNQMATTMI